MKNYIYIVLVVMFMSITSCGNKDYKQSEVAGLSEDNTTGPRTKDDSLKAGLKRFNMADVPISTVPLDTFPYFTAPRNYKFVEKEAKISPKDRFMFWTGDRFERVEGRVFYDRIVAADNRKYSKTDLKKKLEGLINLFGGVKVFEGVVPFDSVMMMPDHIKIEKRAGLGNILSDPASVHLIRRENKNIWIYFLTDVDDGAFTVVETKVPGEKGKTPSGKEPVQKP